MNPIGFIAGLAAIKTLHKNNKVDIYIIIEWPGSYTIGQDILKIIKIFAKGFPNVRKIAYKNEVIFEKIRFDEIYFSHEMNEGTVQSLFEIFPKAQRICYGDSMGLVHSKKHFLESQKNIRKASIINRVDKFVYKVKCYITKENILKDAVTNQSVLVLPVDRSGEYFINVPLKTVSKKNVLIIIKKCSMATTELNQYIKDILKTANNGKIFLFLTENFAEVGLIDINKEIEMYAEIIKKYCKPDDIIYIKSHPGEVISRQEKIKERLSNYKIFSIDKKYNRYPIEIWSELVYKSTIIATAYPVLSLKYLYNLDIIQPMDNVQIRNWFPKNTQNYVIGAIEQYMIPLKKLSKWDGNSPLYVNKNE